MLSQICMHRGYLTNKNHPTLSCEYLMQRKTKTVLGSPFSQKGPQNFMTPVSVWNGVWPCETTVSLTCSEVEGLTVKAGTWNGNSAHENSKQEFPALEVVFVPSEGHTASFSKRGGKTSAGLRNKKRFRKLWCSASTQNLTFHTSFLLYSL